MKLSYKDIQNTLSEDLMHIKHADGVLKKNQHAMQNHIRYSKVDGYKGFSTKKGRSLLGF